MAKARIKVYDPTNDTLLAEGYVVDGDGHQRNVDDVDPTGEKLNESGSGQVTIQEDHPAHDVAIAGNVVRLCADEQPVFAFRIRERDHQTIARLQRDRTITLDGDGLLEDWRKSVVDPWRPGRPISLDRIWNWAAPRGFDDSSWSTTTHIQERYAPPLWPEAYPAAPAYVAQVWSREYADPQPVGSILIRRPISFGEDVDVAGFHSSDDAANAWADGVLLNRHGIVWPSTDGWQKCWRDVPPCTAGDHVFAWEAFNHGGPAFFMATGFVVNGSVLGDVVFSTGDGGFRYLDYPETKPGFTRPQIVQMLLEEAQARLELLGWSIVVHGVHEEMEEFSCRVGTDYREVLDKLTDGMDIAADPEGLVLHLWPKGGRDNTPAIEMTSASVHQLSVVDGSDVVTAVQGIWSDGVTWRERDPHPTLGRIAKSLQLGSVTDEAAVVRILDAHLDAHESPVPALVGQFDDVEGAVAGVDYTTGDTFSLNETPVRCMGLTWTIDRTGDLVPHPEFDSIASVRRRERLRAVDRLTQPFESPSSAPILSSKPLLVTGNPGVGEWTWSWNDLEDLELDEDPVEADRRGQIKRVDTVKRLWRISLEIDPEDLPDAFDTTTIELLKNGIVINHDHDVSLDTVTARAEKWMFAYEVVTPADRISIRLADDGYGGHVNGAVTVSYADAI